MRAAWLRAVECSLVLSVPSPASSMHYSAGFYTFALLQLLLFFVEQTRCRKAGYLSSIIPPIVPHGCNYVVGVNERRLGFSIREH